MDRESRAGDRAALQEAFDPSIEARMMSLPSTQLDLSVYGMFCQVRQYFVEGSLLPKPDILRRGVWKKKSSFESTT